MYLTLMLSTAIFLILFIINYRFQMLLFDLHDQNTRSNCDHINSVLHFDIGRFYINPLDEEEMRVDFAFSTVNQMVYICR